MLILLLLSAVRSQEYTTPSSLLLPKNYNHHAYQYLDKNLVAPTKQGPVLFPNDAPPPPRPPLIVTSRPLTESVARSELNSETNNSIAEATQIKPEFRLKPEYRVKPGFRLKPAFRPNYLARVKDYQPFGFTTPTALDYGLYSDVTQRTLLNGAVDSRYSDYEEHSALPPIYKAFAEHAKEKVSKLKPQLDNYNYHVNQPVTQRYQHNQLLNAINRPVTQRYQHNDVRDDGEGDYDHASNYAFSYRVKDHKTGDDFSHSQHSSGSATNGEYRVRLPDGRMQIVSYTADENGYKADVRYDDDDKTVGNSIDKKFDHNPIDYNRVDYKNGYNPNNYNRVDYKSVYNPSDYNRVDYRNDYQHTHDPVRSDFGKNFNNNEFINRNYKVVSSTQAPQVKEDYNQYSDLSKEYYNTDYSLEYDGKDDSYAPHKSKFESFAPKDSNLGTIVVPNVNSNYVSSSTVKPSYEELKPLFVTKNLLVSPTENYLKNIELSVPSTTPNPVNFDGTTEHVVLIGTPKPNLYTNVHNLPLTDTPVTVTSNNFVTPRNYLVSTIANLKNGQKPILSSSFIDRINKYLTFT